MSTDITSIWLISKMKLIAILVIALHWGGKLWFTDQRYLKFEISDLNYLHIHVHIIYIVPYGVCWPLRPVTTAFKQPQRSNLTWDLKSVTPTTYLSMCMLFLWYGPFLAASEVTMASKQPGRSNLTSHLKSVTPITYISMCILLILFGPSWKPLRPLQPPNSLGGQNWACRWNWWRQLLYDLVSR